MAKTPNSYIPKPQMIGTLHTQTPGQMGAKTTNDPTGDTMVGASMMDMSLTDQERPDAKSFTKQKLQTSGVPSLMSKKKN